MARQRLRDRLTALLLAVFALGTPLSGSLLDAREAPTRPRAESRHDPGRCSWHHDHAACVQLAHSVALPVPGGSALPLRPPMPRVTVSSDSTSPPATDTPTYRPRAPPTPHS